MSQIDRIKADLVAGRRLTPLDALARHDCLRLGARIYDLRSEGGQIHTRDHETPSGKVVADCRLISASPNPSQGE